MKDDGEEVIMSVKDVAMVVFKKSAIDSTYSVMRLPNLPMYI